MDLRVQWDVEMHEIPTWVSIVPTSSEKAGKICENIGTAVGWKVSVRIQRMCFAIHRGCPSTQKPQSKNKPMCYPQQLGRSWNVFVPEPSGTLFAMCTGTFQNLIRYLPRNPPEPHQLSAPEPSGTSAAFCTGTLQNLVCYLHRNLRNLICYLRQNHPEPHQPSAPEPSGTSSAFCTRTLRNLISFLHRNPLKPHQLSAPEPSRTSSAFCAGTLWKRISFLHQNPPEPSGTFSGTWGCSCTGSHQSSSELKTP